MELNHIDLLARELTDGTKLPVEFARETLKLCALTALGQNSPPQIWMPVHTRQYLILISDNPGAGKGQTMYRVRRTIEKSCLEGNPWPVEFIRGEILGSPQYAVTEFGGAVEKVGKPDGLKVEIGPKVEIDRRVIGRVVHYEEGRMLAEKDNSGGTGRGLFTIFTMLFEDNAASTGSFKNGRAVARQADVSLSLHFTRAGFDSTFTGSGHTSGGFLSRCTLISRDAAKFTQLWRPVESVRVRELVALILEDCQRTELPVDEGVEAIRMGLMQQIEAFDPHKASRLPFLFAQDCLVRGVFSEGGRLSKAMAQQAAEWIFGQYKARCDLWPLDQSSDKYERVHLALRAAFQKAPELSLVDMKRVVHLHRPGSGGIGVFMSVVKQMGAGQEIEYAGRSRKGTPLYKWIAEI